MNEMKPSVLLAILLVGIFSACDGGKPTPTTPSQQSDPQNMARLARVALTAVPNPAVANEATTFEASLSSSSAIAESNLDFGDGSVISLGAGNSPTLKHTYARAGTFIATLNARNVAGDKFSGSVAVVVR
jgi:PKD domain